VSLVLILVADGARPDTLAAGLDAGRLPALARLRDEGGLATVSSVFPSVTGPAYAPFLTGRFPGPAGLPGLRWFDRARTPATRPDAARSYVGLEMRHIDRDLAPDVPTLFELAPPGLAAMNMIGRGLAPADRLARGARFALRVAGVHFGGDVAGWLAIDRDVGAGVAAAVRARFAAGRPPRVVFCALTGIDKASHGAGSGAPVVADAFAAVDATLAGLRADGERGGWWRHTTAFVVSDHGHSPVRAHDDLADWLRGIGVRTVAHPFAWAPRREAAVMVSGNAMAHLYLELGRRARPWWPALAGRWGAAVDALVARPSVDLVLLPLDADRCEVRHAGRGAAVVERARDPAAAPGDASSRAYRYAYRPVGGGDPLALGGPLAGAGADAAHAACAAGDHPDALVQIASLAGAGRAGDVIVSAARDWDLRARYEPIPHRSSHGALHREHMLVPLLCSRPFARPPRRTADVMPSALAALGVAPPPGLDGVSVL
jgi:arylsulfatase A-like enzyme